MCRSGGGTNVALFFVVVFSRLKGEVACFGDKVLFIPWTSLEVCLLLHMCGSGRWSLGLSQT